MKKTLYTKNNFAKIATIIGAAAVSFGPTVNALEGYPWFARSSNEIIESLNNDLVENENGVFYEVKWGDTLSTIAEAVGLSVNELANLNMIDNPDFIKTGTYLYINHEKRSVTCYSYGSDIITISTQNGEVIENDNVVATELLDMVTEQEVEVRDLSSGTYEEPINFTKPAADLEESSQEAVEESSIEEATELTNQQEVLVEEPVVEEVVSDIVHEDVNQVITAVEDGFVIETNSEYQAYEEETPEEAEVEVEETEENPNIINGIDFSNAYTLEVEATAYSRNEAGLTNFTADGTDLTVEPQVIAVDPNVIPLGSLVEIPGYGVYRAADTGGAIIGNRIDVHIEDLNQVYEFGRRTLTIKVLPQ